MLVGDPSQFFAVGRGGMFQHQLDHAPDGVVEHLKRTARNTATTYVGGMAAAVLGA